MRTDSVGSDDIARGLARIRQEFALPDGFAPEVIDAAGRSAALHPGGDRIDRTDLPFITLDPATATDLDQAFCLEQSGDDLILRYAIADVGWFVRPGDPLDREAWSRGTTMYLPDGKVSLYPTDLSEGAASLLPDGPRPAVVFVVRLDSAGVPRLDAVERALVRSRAKLAYDTVTDDDLPPSMPDFAARMAAADEARGAARVEPPEQEVERDGEAYRIAYRPRLAAEEMNAALSLATNLAVAAALFEARTGLYRVMDEPDDRAIRRLRHTARAMGVPWAGPVSLADFERSLISSDPRHAAIMLAIRRAGGGARYVGYEPDVVPWHAAMAATYAHATAPLRRLADRHVVLAALAVAGARPVDADLAAAFADLPEVMQRADAIGNRIDRAVIDLVEAVVLRGQEGRTFAAVVTDVDDRGARIQLCDVAVVSRVSIDRVEPGDEVRVKLVEANPAERLVRFERVA
ncbi:MAG: RNB domain-containing ribonuclease [Actinomycetota bacterium]|nr:MAG: putative ribonuclease [Acidimicrobiaceae bacterium]